MNQLKFDDMGDSFDRESDPTLYTQRENPYRHVARIMISRCFRQIEEWRDRGDVSDAEIEQHLKRLRDNGF